MTKILLGAHVSGAGGLYNAVQHGRDIGATTIQLFTANQKRWVNKPLTKEVIDDFRRALAESEIEQVMSHDSYLINLGSPNPEVLVKSRNAFGEEIERCQALGLTYCNFHPGAALKEDPQLCLDKIVESLLETKDRFADDSLRLLLETTAGQGSNVGWKFDELGYIVERTKDHLPIGVCIDTCHIWAGGYDISTAEGWDGVLKDFDEKIGLEHLYAMHLNDSLKGCGSRVDRHRPLGEGEIGIEAFKFVMQDPRLQGLPKYLETPGGMELWEQEIKMLREFAGQPVKK